MASAALRLKVEGQNRDLTALLAEVSSPDMRSRILADTARELVADADRKNAAALGRVPPKETFVDGRQGAQIDSVRPDGTIVVEYRLLDEALRVIHKMLRDNSPVGKGDDPRHGHPGLYRDSHVVLADGDLIDIDTTGDLPVAEEYVFLNVQPYARRIERGWSPQSPDGVYQVVTNLAHRRFGNFADIGFAYRAPTFGAVTGWAGLKAARDMAKSKRGGNPQKHDEWLRRQPAILVSLR